MSPSRPQPTTETSAAGWVIEGVGPFGSGVRSLIPPVFEAYARILHPAGTADGRDVSWAAIAEWSGTRMHSLVQFEAISRPGDRSQRGPRPFAYDPLDGEPDPDLLEALCEVLGRHTGTPEWCWFCLWDGYGWIHSGGVIITFDDSGTPSRPADPPAFPPEVMRGPRVRLPGRDYILLSGSLETASNIGEWEHLAFAAANPDLDRPAGSTNYQPPNLFWPDDRAWCVASAIDLYSTYVGGSEALIEELLDDRRFESWRAGPTTRSTRRATRSTASRVHLETTEAAVRPRSSRTGDQPSDRPYWRS